MLSYFSEFNWTLILIVITVSAVVAYVGDFVGMKIGKKRISLLHIRPRYTSKIITIMTGVAIAVVTLAFAGFTSTTVRTALINIKYVQRQIIELTDGLDKTRQDLDSMSLRYYEGQEELHEVERKLETTSGDLEGSRKRLFILEEQAATVEGNKRWLEKERDRLRTEKKSLENSIVTLRDESQKLKTGLQQLREGRISAFSGQLLAQVAVAPDPDEKRIEAVFERLLEKTQEMIASRLGENARRIRVLIDEKSKRETIKTLVHSKNRSVLRLTAKSNAVVGQDIIGEIRIFDSQQIYQESELLSRQWISPGLEQEEAADILYTILKNISRRAIARGVLPDPLSGNVGNLDTILFFDMVDRMTGLEKTAELQVLADKNIYSEGPVSVKFILDK